MTTTEGSGDMKVWVVFIGPRSNRKIHSLYQSEIRAKGFADHYNRTHDRQTPAEVEELSVY